jgi:cysteinyl-tRNA synthetase
MAEPSLRLYDTLTAKLQPLVPRTPGKAGVYCCGPTTYDVAHVGHARAALAPDILVRALRARGLEVTYVRNVTDVDDKILKRAGESGEEPTKLSARMAALYQEDMHALGCVPPDVEPRVSAHIADIIALVQKLVEVGSAYVVEMAGGARDVYYAVRSFEGYGKLSKRNVEELRVGARIEASDEKRDPLDFALWKGCRAEAWGWDSPWGKGRPGWHIECSAMSSRYLGHGFDVHCGGMDLIFPHHENEIAQSEAAHAGEGPFAHLWIHNGFVNVDKEKMAKSLGNFVTIRQVYERNDPEALRWFLLGVHYRGPIGFDTEKREDGRVVFPGVQEAERRVDYLYTTLERLAALGAGAEAGGAVPKDLAATAKLAREARDRVLAALDDDLDTPTALAVVQDLARTANELCDLAVKRRKDQAFVRGAAVVAGEIARGLRAATEPVGVLATPPDEYAARTKARRLGLLGLTPEAIEGKLAERAAARQAKDFARADAIRKELDALGLEVADSPTGTTWRVGVV